MNVTIQYYIIYTAVFVTAGCKVGLIAMREWYKRHAIHQQQISTCWRRLFTTRNSQAICHRRVHSV